MADCLPRFLKPLVSSLRSSIREQRKATGQFETKQLRRGTMGFAPVSFRVMMFEIFLLYSIGSSRSFSQRYTVTLVSTQSTLQK